ncbi:hypothetical protein FEM48_Zijuj11G0009700 [Ziziphus jujuba var. spinosa]|uniref:Cellulose synthase-like protein G3 n=1 Tax=Ziziphus jujuba var. spinosa TaxID=714518 RepID=A0A978UFX7_ZIZJJ|nr:hypothetical protein FEM48_Zijuj11G0009700 [Ziziphus jujuba var. spinosa]
MEAKASHAPPLHTVHISRRTAVNGVYAAIYAAAIMALLYHHALTLLHSTTLSSSFFISLCLLISDLVLASMWAMTQTFRMRLVYRNEFPENIKKVAKESEFPALDVFICTADPQKEPAMSVVNTAISVMAYDYPTEKLSVYVSDDGGSALTLFALMEAAKFASHWLPFCRKNNVVERSPEAYFAANHYSSPLKSESQKIKIRVSATMTNAPIFLVLDCDMYSNDPKTPLRQLCYFLGHQAIPNLGFVQFPQRFHGINKNDIYASEYKYIFRLDPKGFDGLAGSNFNGTGCFFHRRALFGSPLSFQPPEIAELEPYNIVKRPIKSQEVLALADRVSSCTYEKHTYWGSKIGFRYGSLVEDYYTSFRLHCGGWTSIFCDPERPAFLGDAPINLVDILNQTKRWSIGLLEVSETWFLLYMFLGLGAYGHNLIIYVLEEGTVQNWWNDQRMWMIRGLSSYLFGLVEYFLKCFGISTQGFNVTSKVVEDEQSKRYEQGIFEFGVPSPIFVPLTMAAILNLVSFFVGIVQIIRGSKLMEELFVQMFIAGYFALNFWPIYDSVFLRSDKGKLPSKTTVLAAFLTWIVYKASGFILRN